MNGVRKLACGVVCAVAAFGFARAADPAVAVAVEDFSTCVPVVTATFDEGAASVAFEWSDAEDGTYTTLGTVANPTGTSCAFTNDWALVGIKRWYRAKVGETTSSAVAFTRFRQLERRIRSTLGGLVKGATTMSSVGPSNSGTAFGTSAMSPFDSITTDTRDVSNPIGINFRRQVHIAGVRFYPMNTGRLKSKPVYASKTFTDYDANKVQILTVPSSLSYAWIFCAADPTETYQCCWVSPDYGSLCEMEIYGWEPAETETANGCITFEVQDYTNCPPILTATVPFGADSAAIEVSRSAEDGYTTLASVDNPNRPTLCCTNTAVKTGVKRYYRVASTFGSEKRYGRPFSFTRWRRLERSPTNETVRLSKYEYWGVKAFNGSLKDNCDPGTTGVYFKEPVWLAGLSACPRTNYYGRLNNTTIYGARTKANYDAGVTEALSSPMRTPTFDFYFTELIDTENTYECVWFSPNSGSVEEARVYGWDQADIEAARESVFPRALTAVSGANVGEADLTWSGAHYIETYELQYRKEGSDTWTDGPELDGELTSYTLTGLENGNRYEFRLKGTGEDEYVGYSPLASALVFKYVPAAGTGLRALLMGDCHLGTKNASRPFFEKRVFASVDFDQTDPLFLEEAHTNSHATMVCFRGEVEIPLDGTYTLKIVSEAADGIRLSVDGVSGFNKHPCGGFGVAVFQLTAGRHALEVDWINATGRKLCCLTWACEGVFAEEILPTSQLFPATVAELPPYDQLGNMDFLVGSTGNAVPQLKVLGGGCYRMLGKGGGSRYCATTLTRLVAGTFAYEVTVESVSGGQAGIFIATPDKVDYSRIQMSGSGYLRGYGSRSPGQDNAGPNDSGPIHNSYPGVNFGCPYTLRVERGPLNLLTYKVRSAKPGASKSWITFYVKTNGVLNAVGYMCDDFSSKKLRVGFDGGFNSSYDITISNVKYIKPNFLLIVR